MRYHYTGHVPRGTYTPRYRRGATRVREKQLLSVAATKFRYYCITCLCSVVVVLKSGQGDTRRRSKETLSRAKMKRIIPVTILSSDFDGVVVYNVYECIIIRYSRTVVAVMLLLLLLLYTDESSTVPKRSRACCGVRVIQSSRRINNDNIVIIRVHVRTTFDYRINFYTIIL